MTSVNEPKTGYRIVQRMQDRKAWQVRLFEHIRTAPVYRRLADTAPEDTARELGLVHRGRPAAWAVELVERDREGRYESARIPRTMTTVSTRYVEISASLNSMRADTWDTAPGRNGRRSAMSTHKPKERMQLGADDWQQLEELAVQAAREAVKDIRKSFESVKIPGDERTRIKLGKQSTKELQIQRLAYQLTGRPTSPNPRMTVARWCKTLGIDTPRK